MVLHGAGDSYQGIAGPGAFGAWRVSTSTLNTFICGRIQLIKDQMADPKVVSYIRSELSRGTPLQQIKRRLLSQGWSDYDINQAIILVNSKETDTDIPAIPKFSLDEENKKSKLWIIIPVLIAVIVIGSVSAYFMLNNKPTAVKTPANGSATLQCKLQTNIQKIELRMGVSSSLSVSGFQGGASKVSWKAKNGSVASISPSSGSQTMVKAQNVGSTQIIATDNTIGADCTVSVYLEVKSSMQQPAVPAEPIDCGTNLDCFISASQNCSPARVNYTMTLSLFGVNETTTSHLEIRGIESGKCNFYIRTEKIDLVFPPNIPQATVDQQKELYKQLEGRDGTCKFNISDLASMLNRLKVGHFSTTDFSVADCTGNYFSHQM
jgi:uncharacterized protein YpmB